MKKLPKITGLFYAVLNFNCKSARHNFANSHFFAFKGNTGGAISKSQCCDLGNFSKIRLSGKGLSGPPLTNVRSGLVPVP